MRVLLVAATAREYDAACRLITPGPVSVDRLVTGVGMVPTAFHLGQRLATHPPDLAINVGLCGSFDPGLPPGSVVHVVSDEFSEVGAQDAHEFLPGATLGLVPTSDHPFTDGRLVNTTAPTLASLAALPAVSGITVNTVHGDDQTIAAVVKRLRPQVETMEGAAFFYACLTAGIPCAQIRAVSNVVERRNRAAWKIDEALSALATTTAAVMGDLTR